MKRRLHRDGEASKRGQAACSANAVLLCLFFLQQDTAQALTSSGRASFTHKHSVVGDPNISRSSAAGSSLFKKHGRLSHFEQRRQQYQHASDSSSTSLQMVLTTPESIIEQASTVNLLDDLIDESVRTRPRRPIMMQFDPSSGWIWRRWKGTIFSETWKSCVKNMLYASIIFFLFRTYPGIKDYLEGFGTLWGQLLSVTTFTLTFFVNQSYALWRKCTQLSRRLQGRLHDIGMNLATHATRKVPSNPDEASTYTSASRQVLELMSRYIRLFNLLTYASFTRSHRPVLTPRGMRRLVERGLMTPQEREVLLDAGIPATQRHSAILMWMIRLFVEGRAAGHIQGGDGFEQQTMEKFHVIRAQYGAIGDELQGRMPLAYTHIVQVLVDLILWMYPVMAFSIKMSPVVTIVGTGLLTVSYQGLFDLAKQFLDPYDNENYGKGEDPLSVDTLIAETNAGSVRWMYGFEEMPFSQQRLRDGELYDYLLPVRGYSVEELAQMEEERIQREKELEEQRIREEEEQRLREEQERLQREAEESEADAEEVEEELVLEANGEVADMDTSAEVEMEAQPTSESVEGVVVEDIAESADSEDRQVHKVTTLADGTVVSLKDDRTSFVGSEVEKQKEAIPDVALEDLNGEKLQKEPIFDSSQDIDFVPSLEDFETFKELPWFDEIGPDGQEVRLSQMLADEEYEEDDEIVATEMTLEEYEKKVAEIQENAQSELLETVEILNAAPGQDFEKVYLVKEKKRKEKKESPTYDQTRMDGISQLWGLPPEDLDAIDELQPIETVDDNEFGSIQQLWGGGEGDDTSQTVEDTEEVVGMMGYSGISELWGSPLDDMPQAPSSSTPRSVNGDDTDGINGDSDSENEEDLPKGSFAGLPWYDEMGPDGKEYRLSQMLADEEYEDRLEKVEMAPLTLEDYTEQVEKIMEAAKEEMAETEAILMARPGDDPLGWDYDDEQLSPTTEGDEDSEATNEGEIEDTSDLEVLEMDMAEDEDGMIDGEDVVSEAEDTAQVESQEPVEILDGEENVIQLPESLVEDAAEVEVSAATLISDDSISEESQDSSNTDNTVEMDAEDEDSEAKATDKIEPIFIEPLDGEINGDDETEDVD